MFWQTPVVNRTPRQKPWYVLFSFRVSSSPLIVLDRYVDYKSSIPTGPSMFPRSPSTLSLTCNHSYEMTVPFVNPSDEGLLILDFQWVRSIPLYLCDRA